MPAVAWAWQLGMYAHEYMRIQVCMYIRVSAYLRDTYEVVVNGVTGMVVMGGGKGFRGSWEGGLGPDVEPPREFATRTRGLSLIPLPCAWLSALGVCSINQASQCALVGRPPSDATGEPPPYFLPA